MSLWQRLQLAALGRYCDGVIISTEAWRRPVRRLVPRSVIHHVPVGSNLPDERSHRAAIRAARGWDADTLVLCTLGADRASRLSEYVWQAVHQVSRVHPRLVWCDLGAAPLGDYSGNVGVRTHRPGPQTPTDLARDLAAADVFLAPFEDGASARRTTLAAALQHGVPVVGTRGRNTDAYLDTEHRLILTEVGKPDDFVERVTELAEQPARRNELRAASRALFDERFSWPTIARALVEAIENA
jgi:glycosyltransferase involved in cell wall biosynthesis